MADAKIRLDALRALLAEGEAMEVTATALKLVVEEGLDGPLAKALADYIGTQRDVSHARSNLSKELAREFTLDEVKSGQPRLH